VPPFERVGEDDAGEPRRAIDEAPEDAADALEHLAMKGRVVGHGDGYSLD
jgi:hypothetical protein